MRIEDSIKLDFSDVLIKPKRSSLTSRKNVNLEREFRCLHSDKVLRGIPIMNSNMGTCGTFAIAKSLHASNCFSTVHKFHDHDTWIRELEVSGFDSNITQHMFFPIGMDEDSLKNYENYMMEASPDYRINNIMIDVANGYSESFVSFIEKIRSKYPASVIAAGNVATPEMTEALILAGADIVKVNIGAGSQCTTRLKAGVGYPQLSAVIECADAAHGLNGQIIADGGCNHVSDFAKSFGGGADFVMSGSFFAAVDESDGALVEINGDTYIKNYGMSSKTAQDKFGTGLKDYRSSEGRTSLVKLRGPVDEVINDILGGIRSCCSYVGAGKLKELSKCTTFVRVNNTHNTINESSTVGS